MRSYLQEFIILILIVIILLMKFCGSGNKPCSELKPDTVTIIERIVDTLTYKVKVPVPVPGETVYVPVPAQFDTLQIIKEFYAHRFYCWNYNDTNISLNLRDTISLNRIIARDLSYKILRPTQVITTTTITPPAEQHVKVLAGFMIGGTRQELTSISPQIELITKRDNAYMVGYNLSDKSMQLGLKWKISFRKK